MSKAGALAILSAACVLGQPGPSGRAKIDAGAAEQGKGLYIQFCVTCHGSLAKGTGQGPDLIRSVVVLRDRAGNEIGPALGKLANHKKDLTQAQVAALSQFLKQRVEETVRNRNAVKPPNVLTGDAKTGEALFNKGGRQVGCPGCHDPTGDLAGIASKYDPVTLQQRFLFPRSGGRGARLLPREATVTSGSGQPVRGVLVFIDDFHVSMRADGEYHSWNRGPNLKVEVRDPYATHDEMLNGLTDAEIHNLVAYLATLK